MIQFSISTKLNGSKYWYVSLTIQLNISHLFMQLNDQTVLFQAIQFTISHLFAFSLNVNSIWPIDRSPSIFTNPSAQAGYVTRPIFKRSLTGLNSELSFSKTSCLTKAEEPSLPYYLPIAGGRIIEFIPFPRVLVLWEMQSVSFRIWSRVAVFISYDDNHYTTGTFLSGTTTLGQSGSWNNVLQRLLSVMSRTLMFGAGGGELTPCKMQCVYSTAPAN